MSTPYDKECRFIRLFGVQIFKIASTDSNNHH